MEQKIKALKEAITQHHVADLIQSGTKELRFENNHLTIFVHNAEVLHELSEKENDHHLNSGIAKVYGEEVTYEVKLFKPTIKHDREKEVPHQIHR